METSDPRPSTQGLVSQDDSGLWMKTDPNPLADCTESPTFGENPQDETRVTPPAPALITSYYSVMKDEGADDVFFPPPPPSHMAPFLPAEGSTEAMVNNPSVTLVNLPADATKAKANPSGLDWHHGERQLMAVHNKVDEVKASIAQISEGSTDAVSLSKDKDSTSPYGQDQASMEDTGTVKESANDPSGTNHQDNRTGDECSNVELDDSSFVILSGGHEDWRETKTERGNYPQQEPSSTEENSENETCFDNEGDICGLYGTDSKLTTETVDYDSVETSPPALSSLSMNDDDFESWGPPECECNQNWVEATTNQPQATEIPVSDEDMDTRFMDYNITMYDWVWGESGTIVTQMPRFPISEGSEEKVTNGKQRDGSTRIATDIQQGEQLLQRLQQVQLRHDVCIPENPQNSQQIVQETQGENKADEREESSSHTVDDDDDGGRMNLMEREKSVKNGSKDVDTKGRISLSTMPGEQEQHVIAIKEAGDSDDDQNDIWVAADLSPINIHETPSTQSPFTSTQDQFSFAETAIERQIHEAAQEKQYLQRAGGLFNLADNPDILEIPFKTSNSLESLTTTVTQPCQPRDWQFSEQKMQKEISQEIQREHVLVNLGKIPGGYSKGEVRQLKETKLLFEAFQQDKTEGPTRHRKSPTLLSKGHVYPSVLERTHSLEMCTLKSHPISRAHSLRLHKSTSEMQKSLKGLRSKSPTVSTIGKTRLFHSLKPDNNLCLNRSIDSICSNTSAMETVRKSTEGKTTQESPILKQNPFYKLRPALALQPEVEKDIREAKEREEELRRQRCSLYGENRQNSEDAEKSQSTPTLKPDVIRQSTGKLEWVWPPPSTKDQTKSEKTQQEPKVRRGGGQKTPLWQRWESGLVNGQTSKEKN